MNLPEGWRLARLEELQADEPRAITDGPFGSNLTSAHYTETGARVVRLQNIGDGTFNDAPAYISWDHFESLRMHEVQPGDLLIASLGDVLPRACLAPATLGPAIVKADCIRVRLSPKVDSRWVMYAMQTPMVRRWAARQLHGVGRLRLGLKAIRQIPVPLPPLVEQRRIVDILEDHLSRLDAAEHLMESALRKAQSLPDVSLVQHPLVARAPMAALGELLAVGLSNGRSVQTREGGFPVLRLTALKDGIIDLGEHKPGAWTEDEAKSFLVSPGDLLVSRGNGSRPLVGRGGLVVDSEPAVAYPDTLIRIRVRPDRMQPEFLALIWNSPSVRAQIEPMAKTTAGIYKINQRDLCKVRLPVPSLAEQARVVAELGELRVSQARLRAIVLKARAQSAGLRRAILSAAFMGRLTEGTNSVIEEPVNV